MANVFRAIAILAVLIYGLIAGYVMGSVTEMKYWHLELIDRGLGEHDPETGKWRWKEIQDVDDNGQEREVDSVSDGRSNAHQQPLSSPDHQLHQPLESDPR